MIPISPDLRLTDVDAVRYGFSNAVEAGELLRRHQLAYGPYIGAVAATSSMDRSVLARRIVEAYIQSWWRGPQMLAFVRTNRSLWTKARNDSPLKQA
jgi:hypothetical protein